MQSNTLIMCPWAQYNSTQKMYMQKDNYSDQIDKI